MVQYAKGGADSIQGTLEKRGYNLPIEPEEIQEIKENEEGEVVIEMLVAQYNWKTGKFIDEDGPESHNVIDADAIEKDLNPKDGESEFYFAIEMVPYIGSIWETKINKRKK